MTGPLLQLEIDRARGLGEAALAAAMQLVADGLKMQARWPRWFWKRRAGPIFQAAGREAAKAAAFHAVARWGELLGRTNKPLADNPIPFPRLSMQ